MGTRAKLSAPLAIACALLLSACGGNEDAGTIPQEQGQALLTTVNGVESALEDGSCELATDRAVALANGIDDLPDDVDPKLKSALTEAAANLTSQTQSQCEPPPPPPTGATGAAAPSETPTETPEEPVPTEDPDGEIAEGDDDSGSESDRQAPPGQSASSNGSNGGGNGNANGQPPGNSGGVGSGGR